jgi:hypothetical protein
MRYYYRKTSIMYSNNDGRLRLVWAKCTILFLTFKNKIGVVFFGIKSKPIKCHRFSVA